MAHAAGPEEQSLPSTLLLPAEGPSLLRGHRSFVNDVQISSTIFSTPPTSSFSSPSSPPTAPSLLLLSASDDGTARLWDAESGRVTRALRWKETVAAPQPVLCCAFDRLLPSSFLFTAHGGRIAVWDIAGHHFPAFSPVLSAPLCCLSTRRQGSASDEGEAAACEEEINSLVMSTDGSLLCACDDRGRWLAWTVHRGAAQQTASEGQRVTSSLCPTLDFTVGRTLVLPIPSSLSAPPCDSSRSSSSSLLSAFTCAAVSASPHDSLCAGIGFVSPTRLVSVGFDYRVQVSAIDGGRMIASADVRELLRAYDLLHRRPSEGTSSMTNPPFPQCVAASPSSSTVLVGLGNGALLWVDAALTLRSVAAVEEDAHASAVVSVCHVGSSRAAGAEYWLSAGTDRRIGLWRTQWRAEQPHSRSGRPAQPRGGRHRKQQRGRQLSTGGAPDEAAECAASDAHTTRTTAELHWAAWDRRFPTTSSAVPVSLVWSALHPVKLNAVCATAMVDQEAATERREARSIAMWACGVSSVVHRYDVYP